MKIKKFKLERFFAKYEFNTPYILGASDCETFSVNELLSLEQGALQKFQELKLGYTESLGYPNLRDEISTLYSDIQHENIITFTGAEEGIFILMNVLLRKGDHIIVQYPCYQSLFEIAASIGCHITNWKMDPTDWSLNIEFLKENIRDETKLIIINFPHNPTGMLATHQIYNSIIDIANDNDIHILSDEVYRLLEYESANRLSSACDLYTKAFSLGVMSKAFGLAGLRVGWIATQDETTFNQIAAFKDYTTICNSALSEFFADLALRHRSYIIERNLGIIKENLKQLDSFFKRNSDIFQFIRPLGGSVAFPQLLLDQDSKYFCQSLIKKKGVLLIPSSIFQYGDRHFRIGFGRRNLNLGLSKIEEFIEEEF